MIRFEEASAHSQDELNQVLHKVHTSRIACLRVVTGVTSTVHWRHKCVSEHHLRNLTETFPVDDVA